MAKNKKEKFDIEKFTDFLESEGLNFSEPETLEDGTIKTPRYETGIILLDTLLAGGFPQGKAIGIAGEKGAGKTTILIQASANIINKYPESRVYYIDVEGGATYEMFESMGFSNLIYNKTTNKNGRLHLISAETIQQIAKIIKQVSQDDNTALIIIDSDTMVTDSKDLESDDLGTSNKAVGKNARMWSENSRAINATIKHSNATLIIVHQARVNLSAFIATTEAAGGNALKHIVSAEIWCKRKYWIDEYGKKVKKKEAKGTYLNVSTNKNRLTIPLVAVEFPLYFGRGVSNIDAYKVWLEQHTIVEPTTGEIKPMLVKRGAGYYTIILPSGEYKCQGDEDLGKLMIDNLEEIKSVVNKSGGFSLLHDDSDELSSIFED